MSISAFAYNYFNGFKELDTLKDKKFEEKALVYLKVASYFTVIIPLAVGVVYGCFILYGRIKREYDKKQAERVAEAAARSLPDLQRSPSFVSSTHSSTPQSLRTPTPPPVRTPPRHEPTPPPQEQTPPPLDLTPHFVDFNNELNRLFDNADNNAEDAFTLAEAYREGRLGLPEDQATANSWYIRAANLGHEGAIALLTAMRESVNNQPEHVVINQYVTTQQLQQQADENNPEAMYLLAQRYQEERSAPENDIVDLYRRAADLDHLKAKLELAYLYQRQNHLRESFDLFFDLSNHDDAHLVGLARKALLEMKTESPQLWDEVVNALGAPNSEDSMYRLGLRYELGIGVQVDPVSAHQFYLQLADQGHSEAQTRVGEFNFNSYNNTNLPHSERLASLQKAIEYLKNANSIEANYLLGLIYRIPEKGIVNLDEALCRLEIAVFTGYQPAIKPYVEMCVTFGHFFHNRNNLEFAKHYFQKAAAKGSQLAIERLQQIEESQRSDQHQDEQ